MITILKDGGSDFCMKPVLEDAAAPSIALLRYEEALAKHSLPRNTYVFADIDRLNSATRCEASRLYLRLQEAGCQVFNNPARVRTRFALLRGLYLAGMNPINAYLADEGKCATKFPVFIRVADDHKGSLSELIWDREALDLAIEAAIVSGVPRSAILIVEYFAQEVRPGVFRKSSVYRIGNRFIPDIWWYGRLWDIKGDLDGLVEPEFYEDELRTMREATISEELKNAFRSAAIDYGRLDFGIVDDKICIYEINTYPTFFGPRRHPIPARVESISLRWKKLLAAFHSIDTILNDSPDFVEARGDSIIALREANTVSPLLRFLDLRLSKEYAERGNVASAAESAKAELAKDPQSIKAIANLAGLMISQKRSEEAIPLLEKLVDRVPRRKQHWMELANLLRSEGRLEDARDRLLEAFAVSDGDWKMYLLLARIYREVEDDEAAVEAVERALELAPHESKVQQLHLKLSESVEKVGQQ